MKGFAGFPEGKARMTPIPGQFFSELLPAIDHLAEVKVTLYAFWRLHQKEGQFRYLAGQELAEDQLFMRGLGATAEESRAALADGLERAVQRGTLLQVTVESSNGEETFYFMNTPKGRAAVEAMTRGEWRPSGDPQAPLDLSVERPNVFTLYEQNIGPLTPMVAEELREAEESYPARWLEDAIRIAVENNVRKLRYVRAILEDWRVRGRDDREDRRDTEKARRRYVEGEFADYIHRD